MNDEIHHPAHYANICNCPSCGHPVEAIQITESHGFRLGSALKYLLRAGKKGDRLTDLRKAAWYIDREIGAEAATRQPVPGQYGAGSMSPGYQAEMAAKARGE